MQVAKAKKGDAQVYLYCPYCGNTKAINSSIVWSSDMECECGATMEQINKETYYRRRPSCLM